MVGPSPNTRNTPEGAGTRERLLEAAADALAARGFHGASLGQIAAAVGIAKPTLLHHFPTKAALYSAVLADIGARMHRILVDIEGEDEWQCLASFVDRLVAWSDHDQRDAQILMREILDAPGADIEDRQWYLKPLMDGLRALIDTGIRAGRFRAVDRDAMVLELLGMHHYFVVLSPTLRALHGEVVHRRLVSGHPAELLRMLEARLLA